jgi:hypothetical protein
MTLYNVKIAVTDQNTGKTHITEAYGIIADNQQHAITMVLYGEVPEHDIIRKIETPNDKKPQNTHKN